jgi:glyoxylase-like metal-dependent hydrolase (beta-lactamase superfamily II)
MHFKYTQIFILPFASIAPSLTGIPRDDREETVVETTKLASNLYKLRIDVVNTVALIGPEGVFLSDSAFTDTGELLTNKLRELGGDTLRFLLCTHYHHDHCGGAVTLGSTTGHDHIDGRRNPRRNREKQERRRHEDGTRPGQMATRLDEAARHDRRVD